jgi:N,N-dimethylformamidase beta subunit-like protein
MSPDGAILSGPGLDFRINDGAVSHPWFAGTGLGPGSVLRRIVGYEWDRYQDWCPPAGTPTVLFHREATGPYPSADMVTFTAPSGATVFAAGTLQFSWALDGYGPAAGHVDVRLAARRAQHADLPARRRPPTTLTLPREHARGAVGLTSLGHRVDAVGPTESPEGVRSGTRDDVAVSDPAGERDT